jgi:hypothetical protein
MNDSLFIFNIIYCTVESNYRLFEFSFIMHYKLTPTCNYYSDPSVAVSESDQYEVLGGYFSVEFCFYCPANKG